MGSFLYVLGQSLMLLWVNLRVFPCHTVLLRRRFLTGCVGIIWVRTNLYYTRENDVSELGLLNMGYLAVTTGVNHRKLRIKKVEQLGCWFRGWAVLYLWAINFGGCCSSLFGVRGA